MKGAKATKSGSPQVIDITIIGKPTPAAIAFVKYTLSPAGLAQYKRVGSRCSRRRWSGPAVSPAAVKVSWAASPAAAAGGAVRGGTPSGQRPGRPGPMGGRVRDHPFGIGVRMALAGAGVIWVALLGPVITLLAHLSWSAVVNSLSAPGALDPLVVSVESGAVTLAVLCSWCTPLAWMLARGTLPFPRFWEAGVCAACCFRRWSSACC